MIAMQKRRRAAGMSQYKAAEMLGVRQAAISKWELGKNSPDVKTLKGLAKLYSCTVDELIADAPEGREGEGGNHDGTTGKG